MIIPIIFLNWYLYAAFVSGKRYVMIIWNNEIQEKLTAAERTMRLRERDITRDKDDPSVAEYKPGVDGKFKLKYKSGYLCRDKKTPGVVVCKNSDEKYTDWEFESNSNSSKLITEGLCLRRMGIDNNTGEGGRYLNASHCYLQSNSNWSIEDVDFDEPEEKSSGSGMMMIGSDTDGKTTISTFPATSVVVQEKVVPIMLDTMHEELIH